MKGERPTSVTGLAAEMDSLQRRLFAAGLPATAKRINEAQQRLGWEWAETRPASTTPENPSND